MQDNVHSLKAIISLAPIVIANTMFVELQFVATMFLNFQKNSVKIIIIALPTILAAVFARDADATMILKLGAEETLKIQLVKTHPALQPRHAVD